MMKVVFFLCCLFAATSAQVTIAQFIAQNTNRFTQWNQFAQANPDIAAILSGNQAHTVILVPDQNFPAAGSTELTGLQQDAELAARTIRLHIIPDTSTTLANPVDGAQFTTLSGAQLVWNVQPIGNPANNQRTITVRGVNPNEVQNVLSLEAQATNPAQVFQVANINNGILYIGGPLLTFRNAQVAPTPVVADPLGPVCIDGECAEEEHGCIDNDQLILRSRRFRRNSIVSLSFALRRAPTDDDNDVDFNFFTIDDGDVDDDNVGPADDDGDSSSDDDDNTIDPEDHPTCDRAVLLEESYQCRLNVSRSLRGSQWSVRTRIDGVDFDSCNNLTIGYMDPWNRDQLFGGDYAGIAIGSLIMGLVLLAAIIPALMAPPTPPPAFLAEDAPIVVETPNLVDVPPPMPPIMAPMPMEQFVGGPMVVDPGFAPLTAMSPGFGGAPLSPGFGGAPIF